MGLGVGSASIAAQLAERGVIEDVVGLCYGSFGPDMGATGEQSKNGAVVFGRIPEEGQLGLQWTPLARAPAVQLRPRFILCPLRPLRGLRQRRRPDPSRRPSAAGPRRRQPSRRCSPRRTRPTTSSRCPP